MLQCVSSCQPEDWNELGCFVSGGWSCLVPSGSPALGPAASVRSASLGTRCGVAAPCLGTEPDQSSPLQNRHHDSGRSWRREHGGGGEGHLPAVTSGPISLTSGLLPKPGTAAWGGEVAPRPSNEHRNSNLRLVSQMWCCCSSDFLQCCVSAEEFLVRTSTETQQGQQWPAVAFFDRRRSLEDATSPWWRERSELLFWKMSTEYVYYHFYARLTVIYHSLYIHTLIYISLIYNATQIFILGVQLFLFLFFLFLFRGNTLYNNLCIQINQVKLNNFIW